MSEPQPVCKSGYIGHVWTNQFGDDWSPEVGTPCDCGKRTWGEPKKPAKSHPWRQGGESKAADVPDRE